MVKSLLGAFGQFGNDLDGVDLVGYFSQDGGLIGPGFELEMDAPSGGIYYTTDGTDPRAPGGGLSPTAQVYRGAAMTTDAFNRVQVNIKDKLRGYEKAGFAYCVCKKNRSKIVYVYTFSGLAQKRLAATCQEAATQCGGCFKQPLVASLRSTAYYAAQEDDRRRREFMQLFGGDGDMGGPSRKVLPTPGPN